MEQSGGAAACVLLVVVAVVPRSPTRNIPIVPVAVVLVWTGIGIGHMAVAGTDSRDSVPVLACFCCNTMDTMLGEVWGNVTSKGLDTSTCGHVMDVVVVGMANDVVVVVADHVVDVPFPLRPLRATRL